MIDTMILLEKLLSERDWTSEFSDDHDAWHKGVEQRAAIEQLWLMLDPVDYEKAELLFRLYAPEGFNPPSRTPPPMVCTQLFWQTMESHFPGCKAPKL